MLFDLDGTLIQTGAPFYDAYFRQLAALAIGIASPADFVRAVTTATEEVRAEGTGTASVGIRLLDRIAARLRTTPATLNAVFAAFYEDAYPSLCTTVTPLPRAAELLKAAAATGAALCLASDPVFPAAQLVERLAWGGISPAVFAWVPGCYEVHALKPRATYFRELASHFGVAPDQCLMIGNDAERDAPAASIGMQVFLLTGPAHGVIDHSVTRDAETVPLHGDVSQAIQQLQAWSEG